jgi:hypothetical protein
VDEVVKAEFQRERQAGAGRDVRRHLAGQSMAEDAFTPPLIPQWIEVSNVLWPNLQAAIVGEMDPQEALDDAAAEGQGHHGGRGLHLSSRRAGHLRAGPARRPSCRGGVASREKFRSRGNFS